MKINFSGEGLRIQTRIMILVTTLIALVIASVGVTLAWERQRRLSREALHRVDTMVDTIDRIARESVRSHDEVMLLSYLKHLLAEMPQFELAIVSRAGYTSVLGEVKTELYYRTIEVPGETPLVVQIGLSKTVQDREIRQVQRTLFWRVAGIAGFGLLLGLAGSWWVSRALAKPIVALAARFRSMAENKSEVALEVDGDEIAFLEKQYECMAQRINEHMRFKEDLLMTLTHELSNPLTGLKGLLGSVQQTPLYGVEALDTYKTMDEAVHAMELSLSNAVQLLTLGHRPVTALETVRIDQMLQQIVRLFRPVAQSNGIDLRLENAAAPVSLKADLELTRRIFINLISNACKYTPSGGMVTVTLKDSADVARIMVSDTGPGIAPEHRELIFTKFYRVPGPDGKPQRIPGSGLGLAIAKHAVDVHQGKIWIESEPGRGSVFHVALPKREGVAC
jgi:signal transduction histidine kinase